MIVVVMEVGYGLTTGKVVVVHVYCGEDGCRVLTEVFYKIQKKLLKYCNTTKSSCKNLKANFKFCINYKNTRSILVQKYVF